ncbi:hypothetical protein L1887_22444 [Cichorium endivia]|nr:hypothetical protein L1887_22444 [Cichorium endivia]
MATTETLMHFTHDHMLSLVYLHPNYKDESSNEEEEEEEEDENDFVAEEHHGGQCSIIAHKPTERSITSQPQSYAIES